MIGTFFKPQTILNQENKKKLKLISLFVKSNQFLYFEIQINLSNFYENVCENN